MTGDKAIRPGDLVQSCHLSGARQPWYGFDASGDPVWIDTSAAIVGLVAAVRRFPTRSTFTAFYADVVLDGRLLRVNVVDLTPIDTHL